MCPEGLAESLAPSGRRNVGDAVRYHKQFYLLRRAAHARPSGTRGTASARLRGTAVAATANGAARPQQRAPGSELDGQSGAGAAHAGPRGRARRRVGLEKPLAPTGRCKIEEMFRSNKQLHSLQLACDAKFFQLFRFNEHLRGNSISVFMLVRKREADSAYLLHF